MANNLKKIRESCIEANPGIMELKFGCQILFEDKIYTIARESSRGTFQAWYNDYTYAEFKISVEDSKQILGRPIRLADVLLALEDNVKESTTFFAAFYNKKFLLCFRLFMPNPDLVHETEWNLKDDNLEHQSEETINFIASLL